MKRFKQLTVPVLTLLTLLTLCPGQATAQVQEVLKFEHLTPDDGLSQSTGRAILQDHEGYMWFGTYDGLNRYDGYDMTIYKPDPGDVTSISNNEISDLFEDSRNNLWIGTLGAGLNLYNRDLDNFIRYNAASSSVPASRRLNDTTVNAIAEDSDGNIWIGTDLGVNIIKPEEETITYIQTNRGDPGSLSNNIVTFLYRDRGGFMWAGTSNGLNRYNPVDGSFDRYLFSTPGQIAAATSNVRSIYEAEDGSFWVGTQRGGLVLLDRSSGSYITYTHSDNDPYSLSDNSVFGILEDNRANFWIGTENGGLNLFDRETERFYAYTYDSRDPSSLNNNAIYTMFLSRDNILWIGTYNGGINYSDRNYPRFEHFFHNPARDNSLSMNSVLSFTEDRSGNIWVGTDGGGLNRLNIDTGEFRIYRHEQNNSNSPGNDVIMSLETGNDGDIWIGAYRGGLSRFDQENQSFTHYRFDPSANSGINNDDIFALYSDPDDENLMWVGSNGGGINLMDVTTGEFTYYLNDPENPRSLANNFIRDFYKDTEDRLWIGHYGGSFSELNPENGNFTAYALTDENRLTNAVQAVHEDWRGNLWLATRGGGIKLFDRENGTLRSFTEQDGLANNTVHGILEDNWRYLWFSTNNGISRFEVATETFYNYGLEAGLQSLEFNPGAYFMDSSGYMYFGGVNGFNRFHPDSVTANLEVPPVVLTDFRIQNRSVQIGGDSPLQKQISQAGEIVLPWGASVLTFEFAALNYSVNKANRFAYRLDGFDSDWNEVGTQRTATYTNLSPGEYIFRVRAANGDNIWSSTDTTVALVITPPFWRTTWFYLLMGLCMTGLIAGGFRYRVRSITRQNRRLGQEVKQQTAELFDKNGELEKTLNELKKTRGELIEKAHKAGMADLATNVLHNVGNILNSVNVSTTLIDEILTKSRLRGLKKANALLREHKDDLKTFILHDPKGIKLLEYYLQLEGVIEKEYKDLQMHKDRLSDNVNLIVDVVAAQQSYSQAGRLFEKVVLEKVLDDTLTLQAASIERHGLQVERKYGQVTRVEVEKSKLIHTLINILKNAKEAMEGMDPVNKRLVLRTFEEDEKVCLSISDSGEGIEKEKLKRIFTHGFTTKQSGHGFGLHSCANYMQEIGGEIRVESDGPAKGSTVILCFKDLKSGESAANRGRPTELVDKEEV